MQTNDDVTVKDLGAGVVWGRNADGEILVYLRDLKKTKFVKPENVTPIDAPRKRIGRQS